MIKPELTMTAAAQAAGGQLLGRLQYSNALSSAVRLGQLREALADASAAAAAQSTALTAAVAGQEPNLTALKSKVQPRVKGAARLVADREISQFRTQLEGRLHKARDGRDKALHKFSERHAAACAAQIRTGDPRAAHRGALLAFAAISDDLPPPQCTPIMDGFLVRCGPVWSELGGLPKMEWLTDTWSDPEGLSPARPNMAGFSPRRQTRWLSTRARRSSSVR